VFGELGVGTLTLARPCRTPPVVPLTHPPSWSHMNVTEYSFCSAQSTIAAYFTAVVPRTRPQLFSRNHAPSSSMLKVIIGLFFFAACE
jgi:hypothetical protein